MWSNKYIGIPYKPLGRSSEGVDCWGLVRLVYAEQYSISLPSLVDSYTHDDKDRISELISLYEEGWEKVEVSQPGDIVLFRIMGEPTHVGIVVEEDRFIHSILNKNVSVENLSSISWAKRIVGYYRYKSNSTSAVMNVVPHPLKTQRYTVPVPPGTTVSQVVEWVTKEYGVSDQLKRITTILVNGKVIDSSKWSSLAIKEGDTLEYRVVPQGGDGGFLRLFLTLALVIAAPYAAAGLTSMAAGTGFMAGVSAFSAAGLTGAGGLLALTGGSALGFGLAQAGVMLAGSLLINAIAPIRMPEQKTPGEAAKIYLSTGSANRMLPYEPIPVVLGKVRMTPPLGAENVSRYQNETDTYLDMLLIWGYGPLSIDENSIKIGDTPLQNYVDGQGNPTYRQETINHITNPSQAEIDNFNSIYGKDINQELVNIPLTCDGHPEQSVPPGPWVSTSILVAEESPPRAIPRSLELAIAFPQGLRKIKTKGKDGGTEYNAPTVFELQWRHATATNNQWRAAPTLKLGGQSWVDQQVNTVTNDESGSYSTTTTVKTLGTDSIKKDGFVWYNTYELPSLSGGVVEVQIRRTTGDDPTPEGSDFQWVHQAVFQTAKLITNLSPAKDPPGCKIAKTALTIKATDQLNGNIEGINALVQTYCLRWNGSSWVNGPTSNPAALFRYILTHPANPRKVLANEVSSKININQLQYWSTYCDSKGFEYNAVEAGGRSIMEILRDICAAGRASPALIDGKWTVVIDEPRTTIVQHFTPHNSWGFQGSKIIPQLPDALKINYVDQDQGYQQAETAVVFPGVNQNSAQLFETIDLPGVTKKSVAQDHARWHIAQIKLRPEVYTLNTDIEYIVCNRGDRVKVTHDVPMWGLGSGRIKDIVIPGLVYDLDEQIFIEPDKSYTIRIRSKTGTTTTKTLDRQFNIISAQKVLGGVRVTLNEAHSVLPGNYINVAGLPEISGNSLLVTEVTTNTITYEKVGPYFNTQNYVGNITLIGDNYKRIKISQSSTTNEIDFGDLFLFGELNQEAQDLIVLGIEPIDNKNARITMVDYGVTDTYNIFTDYQNLSPNILFETQISLPPEGVRQIYGSAQKPRIISIYSGYETLEKLSVGTYQYTVRVTYVNIDNITTKTKYVECQYNFVNAVSNNSAKSVLVPYNQGYIVLAAVAGTEYKVRLRYVSEDGATGPWTLWQTHSAQGLVDANNLPLSLYVDRITRYLEIVPTIGDGTFIPEDFKSYEYRVYKNSGNPQQSFWDVQDPLIQVKFSTSPVRFNLREFARPRLSLLGVQYRIACRVLSTTGRYVSSPALSNILITSLI